MAVQRPEICGAAVYAAIRGRTHDTPDKEKNPRLPIKDVNNPLISIVVCCYKLRQLLEKTMESIFAQRYQPVEVVVVDDGSTATTAKLMAGYGGRVRYFRVTFL